MREWTGRAIREIRDGCQGKFWPARALLYIWFVYILFNHVRNPDYQSFLAGLNLGIHEFGHLICQPFGEFVAILGGSLVQCLVPLVSFVMFYSQRDYFAFSFSFVWLGSNFLGVARYIADARTLELHLMSPFGSSGDVIHDWNYILHRMNLLTADQAIATWVQAVGYASMGIGLAWGAWTIYEMVVSKKPAVEFNWHPR